jgi:predicted transcriptional regulator
MPSSIPEMLQGNFKCEDVIQCLLGLKTIDVEAYKTLFLHGPLTAEALGEKLKRERSTAYRALQNLINLGLVYRELRTIESGGYYYEYLALPPEEVKAKVKRNVEAWYKKVSEMIETLDRELIS